MIATRTTWREEYARKLTTPDEAVKAIISGDTIYIQGNAACPETVLDALCRRAGSLENVTIFPVNSLGRAEYVKPQYAGSFRVKMMFAGKQTREAVNDGNAEYLPLFLSETPFLMESRRLPVNVCLLQLSPPDRHGVCSLGVSVDASFAARKHARVVIAEINKQMPRTMGRSFIHISQIDHIVEVDKPLFEYTLPEATEVEKSLGQHVAELVEDEATIQLGIGGIPDAVLKYLGDKKNLGVHSEMVSDGIVDLMEKGVITNERKTVLPGKSVVSFLIGTRRLYDYVDNNSSFELHPIDFTNNPVIIAQNHKMTSINSALLVDVTGQIGADSMGSYLYSGFGGQVDFVRGACMSRGGKAIIALPSTAKNGTVSRITACLPLGTGVVTSRADVHYVATEYGIAELFGKTLKERARALINIAHPKFREALELEVRGFGWMGV